MGGLYLSNVVAAGSCGKLVVFMVLSAGCWWVVCTCLTLWLLVVVVDWLY